jgi:hypothetical protein
MKTYNQFINESIRDLMKPKSNDDVKKALQDKTIKEKLFFAIDNDLDWLVEEILSNMDSVKVLYSNNPNVDDLMYLAFFKNIKIYRFLCENLNIKIKNDESLINEINKYKELVNKIDESNTLVDKYLFQFNINSVDKRISYISSFIKRASDDGYLSLNLHCHYNKMDYNKIIYSSYYAKLDKDDMTINIDSLDEVIKFIKKTEFNV